MPSTIPVTLSYASSVIGLVSFAFTLSIFFGTFASAISTLSAAPREVRDNLSNLRFELYEEREALRKARSRRRRIHNPSSPSPSPPAPSRIHERDRSRSRPGLRGGAGGGEKQRYRTRVSADARSDDYLRVAAQTIKDLIRDFKRLERPFLTDYPYPRGLDPGYDPNDEDLEAKTHVDTAENPGRYYRCDFPHRFIWLKRKSDVVNLASKVARVQITRIEREGHATCMQLSSLGDLLRDIDDRLWGIEDRLRMMNHVPAGGGVQTSRSLRHGER